MEDDNHCKHGTSSDTDHTALEDCSTEASQPPEGTLPCENCHSPDEKLETHMHPVTDLQTPEQRQERLCLFPKPH